MKVEHCCCAGLDVHKRTVVACVLKGQPGREPVSQTKSFGTTTAEVMEMLEGFKEQEVTSVAKEATGNCWMPIYNLLEGHFELIVANAVHMKAVLGRKSDVQDAEWIANLLGYGLLRASFIPAGRNATCGSSPAIAAALLPSAPKRPTNCTSRAQERELLRRPTTGALPPRRGKKKALLAGAHSLAIAIYHMLKFKTAHRELGAGFFDKLNPLKLLHRLTRRQLMVATARVKFSSQLICKVIDL